MSTETESGAAVEPESKSKTITGIILQLAGVSLILVVVLGMLLPAFNAKRESGKRMYCASNLKQIGLALILYANEDKENGYFPDGDSFERLHLTGFLVNGKIYACPSCDDPNTLAKKSNYVYLGAGLKHDHPDKAKVILAHDRIGNHKDWVTCLYVDGHATGYRTKAKTAEAFHAERIAAGDVVEAD